MTWITLSLRHYVKGSGNVIKHSLYRSVYAMPIINIFLLEQDDETLDSFYILVGDFCKVIDISKFQTFIYKIK